MSQAKSIKSLEIPDKSHTLDALEECRAIAKVSKHWTPSHEMLEQNGEFQLIADSVQSAGFEQSLRAQAALGRALAFLGQTEKAHRILESLLQNSSLDHQTQAIAVLGMARIHREKSEWETSKELAQNALALANEHPIQAAEALFAIAISDMEPGNVFPALEIYQTLRKDMRLPSYRRQLAALNEAWILWDLGRVDSVRKLLGQVPEKNRMRLELYLAAVDGRVDVIESLWTRGSLDGLAHPEHFRFLMVLVHSALILAPHLLRSTPGADWILDEMRKYSHSQNPEHQALAQRCLVLLGQATELASVATLSWRCQFEAAFLECLANPQGESQWRERVQCLLDTRSFSCPLIPSLDSDLKSLWAQALGKHLKWKAHSQAPSSSRRVSLQGFLLRLDHSSLDLSTSATTAKLIRILAGPKGRKISKREIHLALTRSAYQPALHNDRIDKLLARLGSKLEKLGHERFWVCPGDQTVCLTETVEAD